MAGLPDIDLSHRHNPTLSGIREYVNSLAGDEGIYTQLMRNTRQLGEQIAEPSIRTVILDACDRIQAMLHGCNQKMEAVPAIGYFNAYTVLQQLLVVLASTLEEMDILYLQNFLDMHANGLLSAQELQDARQLMQSLFTVQSGISGYFATLGHVCRMPTIANPSNPESCEITLADGRKLPDLNQEFEGIFTELQGNYSPERRTVLADSQAAQYFIRNCKALMRVTAAELEVFNVDYFALKLIQPVIRSVVTHVLENMQSRLVLLPKLDEVPPLPLLRVPSRTTCLASPSTPVHRDTPSPLQGAFSGGVARHRLVVPTPTPHRERSVSPHRRLAPVQVPAPALLVEFDAPLGAHVDVTQQTSFQVVENAEVQITQFDATLRVRVATPKPK